MHNPLGLSIKKEDLLNEKDDIHIGFLNKRIIVGTLVLSPVDNNTIKIRQVAVRDDFQGNGIGRKLVEYAEQLGIENNYTQCIISARTSVLEFYTKLGYIIDGNEYISNNSHIPHFKLVKSIKM